MPSWNPYLAHLLNDVTPVLISRYLGGGFHSSTATTPAQEAARALAKIGDPALKTLQQAARSEDENVRRLAFKALGQIGDLSSLDLLVNALQDPSRKVQASAAMALGNYHNPIAAQRLMEKYPALDTLARIQLIYSLAQINDIIVVPFLIEQSEHASADERAAIALALGKLRDGRALASILQMSNDPDEIVRANAVYALSGFYTPHVMDVLVACLADPSARVRAAAHNSLTKLTGLDLGENHEHWLQWWQQQKQAMSKGKQSSQ